MLDPEPLHRRLTSGDAAAIRERAGTLLSDLTSIDSAAKAVLTAAQEPVWTGDGAAAFQLRSASVLAGAGRARLVLDIVRTSLDHVAPAYVATCSGADDVIAYWRNRPAGMPDFLEELLAAVVSAHLVQLGNAWNDQLTAATAVVTGDGSDLDLDDLDEDTRKWVQKGLDKTEDWLDDTGSSRGPLIPNTKATGDDRGLTPQGLGYDPASGSLLQTYYKKGEPAILSVIDPTTGREITEITLNRTDDPTEAQSIGHAGGVTVDGDNVYVSSGSSIYTYSLSAIQHAGSGGSVTPTGDPFTWDGDDERTASYTTFKDGKLYVGDFGAKKMYVYEKDPSGGWRAPTDGTPSVYPTPDKTQGVVVRDGEFVFSTSEGRGNASHMVVEDRDTGERTSYDFPNMSEGVVEVNGQLITTYESGAGQYDHWNHWTGWFWGVKDADSLWASPYMTSTPLSELGLSPDGAGELQAEPSSLHRTALDLADPAADLKKIASSLDEVTLPAHLLGEAPAAPALSSAVESTVGDAADSTRTAASAVGKLGEAVELAARGYEHTDDHVAQRLQGLNPWG